MRDRSLYRRAWASQDGADLYDRARPGYAPTAVEFVLGTFNITRQSTIVDLAAGTGKLTRSLLGSEARIIAVEPLPGMRSAFVRALPSVEILEGTAEAIPLPANSVDLVVVAQAWHWFDSARALAEVSRVTVPGGGLALLWNQYDESKDWVREYAQLRHWGGAPSPWNQEPVWTKAFEARRDWTPLGREVFSHQSDITRDGLVDRMLSSSVITVLPAAEQAEVREAILAVLDRYPDTRDRETVIVPYETEVFWSVHNL